VPHHNYQAAHSPGLQIAGRKPTAGKRRAQSSPSKQTGLQSGGCRPLAVQPSIMDVFGRAAKKGRRIRHASRDNIVAFKIE
jgi:hypothetical protein